MHKAKVLFLMIIMLGILAIISIDISYANELGSEQNIKALNHLYMSLYRISNYNNKAVLDEEYDTINNDIRLDALGDKKLVGIIQDLMDALTALRISEKERARMQSVYEKMQEDLMLDMLRSGGKTIGTGLAHAAINGGKGLMTGGPLGAAAGVIASVPTVASSVTKPAAEMRLQKQKIEDFEWSLDVDKLKSLNELNKKFISTYWDFLHDSNVQDSLRISEKQLSNLYEVNKEKDPATKYRMLVRLEKECNNIPSYWYYRADAAHDLIEANRGDDITQEKRLISEIKNCLDRYRELAGILRKDSILASLIMLHLSTAPLTPEEVKTEISELVDTFPLDASKRLFAALTFLKHDMTDDAVEQLNANLDLRQYEVISRRLLADIYDSRKDEKMEAMLIQKLINEDSASNQEILYHLGKLQTYDKFIAGIEPQLNAIKIQLKSNIVGNDDLELLMPMKWEIIENAAQPASMEIDGKQLRSAEMELTKDGKIKIVFKKAVKYSELDLNHPIPVVVEIMTKHFPIIIEGTMNFPDGYHQGNQGIMSKIKGTAKKIIPKSNGAFKLEKIKCEGASFEYEGGKWISHR